MNNNNNRHTQSEKCALLSVSITTKMHKHPPYYSKVIKSLNTHRWTIQNAHIGTDTVHLDSNSDLSAFEFAVGQLPTFAKIA